MTYITIQKRNRSTRKRKKIPSYDLTSDDHDAFVFCIVLYLNTCYSAPHRFLFRGAPDYCADAESEFHAEAHDQLRVKDLPRVPTRRLLRWIRTLQLCKAPNIPLHHRAPVLLCCIVLYC